MPNEPSLIESGTAALETARGTTASDGWTVRMDPDPPARIVLHFSHVLSGEHSVSFKVESSLNQQLTEVLQRREFRVAAHSAAPRSSPLLRSADGAIPDRRPARRFDRGSVRLRL